MTNPAEHYRIRLEHIEKQRQNQSARSRTLLRGILLAGLAAVLCAVGAWKQKMPATPAIVLAIGAAVFLPGLLKLRYRDSYRLSRLADHLETASDRTTEKRVQSGLTGEEFRESNHIFDWDLNILGSDSIFGVLTTVRTHIAQRNLARSLLHPPSGDEATARQRAIQELQPLTELRERIALLGDTQIQQIPAQLLETWLDEPEVVAHPATRTVLAITAAILILLAAIGGLHLASWSTLEPNFAAVLAIQAAVALRRRERLRSSLERAGRLAAPIAIFQQALQLLATEHFTDTILVDLQQQTIRDDSTKALHRLQTHLTLLDQRTKEWFYVPCLVFCVGTRSSLAIEAWRRRYGDQLRCWLEAWGEFEVLCALANYAYEHSAGFPGAYTYPEILPVTKPPIFMARGMAHPMLPAGCSTNDIQLDEETRFYLISGSNMAGKSTLLRAVGVNALLTLLGAPIRATAASISPVAIAASLALTDSLADGRSKFLSEVQRLAEMIALAKSGKPVLFLIDEILSGTNSQDRQQAADAVLRLLGEHNAIGMLSTHDLSLTALATQPDTHGRNMHMASGDPADALAFDYLLKPGVNTASSALAILSLLGIATGQLTPDPHPEETGF